MTTIRPAPYRVYTTKFDRVVTAAETSEPDQAMALRQKLSEYRAEHAVLSTLLDINIRASLAQSQTSAEQTAVTLLIDNSGSLFLGGHPYGQRDIDRVAIITESIVDTLDNMGVTTEILGYTTQDFMHGQSRKLWQKSGQPENPGRLNDILYVVYKASNEPLATAKPNLGVMLREIGKENIDGEAIEWAYDRLLAQPVKRRVILHIGDMKPAAESTAEANGENYLPDHAKDVIDMIEQEGRVEFKAIAFSSRPGHVLPPEHIMADKILTEPELVARRIGSLLRPSLI